MLATSAQGFGKNVTNILKGKFVSIQYLPTKLVHCTIFTPSDDVRVFGMVFEKGFTRELRISLLEHCKRTQAEGVRKEN